MRAAAAIVAACLLCIGSKASAEPRNSSGSSARSDPFVSWATVWGDPRREGVFTCEQWKQYAGNLFKDADRNRDGYLDAQEFEAIRRADRMLRDADVGYFDDNRDGRVSRSEFVDKPNPLFARYDKKGTCRLSLDDIVDAMSASQKQQGERARR